MKAEDLKNSILQLAMEGKLVPQDPNDEPASVLLDKIREEKEQLIKDKKIKRNNKESFIFRKNGHFYERIGKKGEPICIDDEIPFEVPDNWEWTKINNIAFVSKLAGFEYTKHIAPNIKTKGIPLFKGKNVKDSKLILNFESFIPEELSDELSRSQLTKKCLLTPYVGTIGNIAIFDGSFKAHLGSNVGKIELFNEYDCKLLEEFVLYYLKSYSGYLELTKHKKSTAQESISITALRDVFIPLPPLNEQKRIVEKIEEMLPFIENYGKYKEQLDRLNSEFPDKLRSSILQEAIKGKLVPQNSNDEPASVLLEKIRDEKERLIKEKKIKRNKNESYIFKENNHFYEKIGKEVVDITNELPFEIPDNWMWCKLENITSNIHYGYTASAQEVGDVRLLRITDIHENNVNWDSVPYCVISEDKLSNYILRNRDIVMARTGGTIGKSYIINNLNKKAVFASYLIRIIPLKNINENYLKQFFESPLFWSQLRDNTKGTGQPNVNANSLKNLLIPMPPFIEQEIIVNKIEKIFNEINLRLKV